MIIVRTDVVVTPLQPSFYCDVMFFAFETDQQLAVSMSDGEKIKELLGGKALGRDVFLAAADGKRIRVYVGQ